MVVCINSIFQESISVKQASIDQGLHGLERMGQGLSRVIQNGNKLMLCGNGGSAADAQHLAAEMLIRLRPNINRAGMPAIALAQDTSTITACGNDFGFDQLYERMVQTLGKEGDVLMALSTSGNSENIIRAMNQARRMGVKVFGFLGAGGGAALELCDEAFVVPSDNTARIQEVHITAGHALMEYVEERLIKEGFLQLQDRSME